MSVIYTLKDAIRRIWLKSSRYQPQRPHPLDTIGLEVLAHVYRSDYSIYRIRTLDPSIPEYTAALRMIVQYMKSDQELRSIQICYDLQEHRLYDWYTHRSMYVNPVAETRAWASVCREFLALYDELSISVNRTYEADRNITLTTPVVDNIKMVAEVLSSITEG